MAKRKVWTRVLGLGVLAAAAYAIWRASEQRRSETGISWRPQPFPFPPEPRADGDDPEEQASNVTS
jgi:hypothetical protein